MRSQRPLLAVSAALAVVLAVGCYGSTEPAADAGFDSALLNGRGTTQQSEAYSFFEYWPKAYPARTAETPRQDWPAEVSGPFSARVRALSPDTSYSFRMCGADAGGEPICAQTRTFRTATPAGDLVVGEQPMAEEFRPLFVNARSGPEGEDPEGSLAIQGRFIGAVTSVEVEGRRAAVVAEGDAFRPGLTVAAAVCLQVADGGPDSPPGAGDLISHRMALTGFGETLGPCLLPPEGSSGNQGAIAVYDAPPGDS